MNRREYTRRRKTNAYVTLDGSEAGKTKAQQHISYCVGKLQGRATDESDIKHPRYMTNAKRKHDSI